MLIISHIKWPISHLLNVGMGHCMRCVQKSLVLSSNLVGISLDSILSTKKISFSLAFHVNSFTKAHVSKLIGQRLFFKTLSAHPLALFGLSLMWIISVCSLYLKLRIRQASTAIACICAKSCIMIFGWCILLVSVVSVKRIKSAPEMTGFGGEDWSSWP